LTLESGSNPASDEITEAKTSNIKIENMLLEIITLAKSPISQNQTEGLKIPPEKQTAAVNQVDTNS
jgi:hypothetical protein